MKLLFEIGTEELPADYVDQGLKALMALVETKLKDARLEFGQIEGFATPRRLALRVSDLAEQQARLEAERRGPPAAAAFRDGKPTKAAEGFARSLGLTPDHLYIKETDKGPYVFARIVDEGRPAREVLPELLAEAVLGLPAKKKMRWGNGEGPFVRPVRWLVALLDGEVLPVSAFGLQAGRTSRGHRIMAPGTIEIDSPDGYEAALREAKVEPRGEARRERIVFETQTLALSEGLEAIIPEDLLEEITGLVEWPVAIMGRFGETYLELPDEVLATVMIHHQRFFPVRAPGGRLTNRFIGIANNERDTNAIREGYEGVLKGRLDDAVFFWRADLKLPLKDHREKLKGMAFARDLGTMWDKAERVRQASDLLAGELEADPQVLERASQLVFADLTTQMVYEFPELAGTMAKHYALKAGEAEAIAQALEDATRPEGAQDALPVTTEGALLSALDKADTLIGFFALGKRPKGSADPYGLRRAAFALVRILGAKGWHLPLRRFFEAASEAYGDWGHPVPEPAVREAETFAWERLENLLTAAGLPVLAVRAAMEEGASVRDVMLKALILRTLVYDPRFTDLFLLYKRAANLAREAQSALDPDPSHFATEEETALYEALPGVEAAVTRLLLEGNRAIPPWDPATPLPEVDLGVFREALESIAAFKAVLDRFLDKVLVMVEDSSVRENRLALLRKVRDALQKLGALELLGG